MPRIFHRSLLSALTLTSALAFAKPNESAKSTDAIKPHLKAKVQARLSSLPSRGAGAVVLHREPLIEPRAVTDPSDPHEQKIAKLREQLAALLRERPLSASKVGLTVMQASDGDVLFAHNAGVQFNPASNTKMLTTAAAIAMLGSDYRYHTALYGPQPSEDGVIHGDVVLRGSGDPSLGTPDLVELAHEMAARGIIRVDGSVLADTKFHGGPHEGEAHPDGVGDGALILNRNAYIVHVSPGEVGHAPSAWVEPRGGFIGVENQATTVHGKKSRLKIDTYRRGDRLIITVRGRIADNRGEFAEARRLPDGALLSAQVVKNALGDFGVEVSGDVRTAQGRSDFPVLLADHKSVPMADVCRLSNKPSNNFIAEAIYKTLGGELFGLPGNLAKGTHAVMDFLTSFGIKAERYRIVNGSGLTHENRITPIDLATLLRKLYFDPAVSPDFMSSLAVGGIDGTIRNRFLGTDAVGLVRAKTGTLNGVSALSGYVGDKEDVLVFSIFVQGFRARRTNEVRHAQVRMVEAMLHFLRTDKSSPNAGERGGPAEDPQVDDSESDGDPTLPN